MYPTAEEPWWGCFVKELADSLVDIGVHVDVVHIEGRADRWNYPRAVRKFRSLLARERFDIVHAHYGLSGVLARIQWRVPVVTTFWGSDTWFPRWQHYLSWAVARTTFPVFVSREGARDLGRPNAVVVPSGVDLEMFQPQSQREARRALGWSTEGRLILFPAAKDDRVKNYGLFEAAFLIAQRLAPDLQQVALDGFSRREVAAVMNAVDVTVLTSDREGSPVAVKESLACTTPVVSVSVGDVEEFLVGLPGCSVVPRRPALIAEALLAAVQVGRHPALRDAVEHLSTNLAAQRTLAVYERVVAR
jgi:glycosyltransferase involved in cell wall biosynthesis